MTPDGPGTRPCRVVLADDEPRLLDALRALLESTGRIEVVASAGSVDEAVETCVEHEPDVVVLDVHMPGGGLTAARRLARLLPALRIVVLTGDETPAVRRRARAAGADQVLDKAGEIDVVAAVLGRGARSACRQSTGRSTGAA